VSLLSQGRALSDGSSILESRVTPNMVVHCVVREASQGTQAPHVGHSSYAGLPGSSERHLTTICGVVLGGFWYLYLTYGSRLVKGPSLFLLFMLTTVYLLVVYAATRPPRDTADDKVRGNGQTGRSAEDMPPGNTFLSPEQIQRLTCAEIID